MTRAVLLLELGRYTHIVSKVVGSYDSRVADGVLVLPINYMAAHVNLKCIYFAVIDHNWAQSKLGQSDPQV